MLPTRQGQSAANTAEASTNELHFKRCECECVNVNEVTQESYIQFTPHTHGGHHAGMCGDL